MSNILKCIESHFVLFLLKIIKGCSDVSTTGHEHFHFFAKFEVVMCLSRILKRWRTAENRFLIKMSLIRMGSYVPAFILRYLTVKSRFLYWGIDLEGVKDL